MKRVGLCLALMGVLLVGCPELADSKPETDKLIVFHNGTGSMCIAALAWLQTVAANHPNLVVETHRTTSTAELMLLQQLKLEHGQSQGISTSFGYLPIIFYRGQAFSGFDDAVRDLVVTLMDSATPP